MTQYFSESGIVRTTPQRVGSGGYQSPLLFPDGSRGLNQVWPGYTEMSRRGSLRSAMNTTALAALVVRPSTVANFTLFNNNPVGSRICYILDRSFSFNLVSTAAEARAGMWICVHPPGLVSPTNDITIRNSSVGKVASNLDNSICDTAMTVIDDGWFPWGVFSTVEPTGVLPGAIMTVEIAGRIIVPPQCGVSNQVVCSVVGNTYTSGFSWYVEQMDIENPAPF